MYVPCSTMTILLIGACPGCSDSPTIPTVNYSNEGGFLPVYTDKLVVMGPTEDPNTAAVTGVAITVAVIAGVLTIVVCFFSVWLIYTLYVKHYIQSRRQRGLRTSICSKWYSIIMFVCMCVSCTIFGVLLVVIPANSKCDILIPGI